MLVMLRTRHTWWVNEHGIAFTRELRPHELHALKEMVQAVGVGHPHDITAHHIVRRTADGKVQSLSQMVLNLLPEGALLTEELSTLPAIYQHHWPLANADRFSL